jgi:nifR3 family TIM-barrel protein
MDNLLGFWGKLPKHFRVLAPMEEVTDRVFRDLVAHLGAPDVWFTEFIGAGNLVRGEREALRRTRFTKTHVPIVAQIWGTDPMAFFNAASILVEMGFDGIDINMGCPQAKITKKGACSALILNPGLAAELIIATKEGISHVSQKRIPVSVKTRIGFNQVQTKQWCGFLLDQSLAALTVHGRIASQMSEGQADWDQIALVVNMAKDRQLSTKIIGNGDLVTAEQLESYPKRYGVHGTMVGRGIFTNPYIFSGRDFTQESSTGKIELALDHLARYKAEYNTSRNYQIMKKFFKIYVQDFYGANELRDSIMNTETYEQAEELLTEFLIST